MLIQRFAAVALGIMMGTSLLLQTGTVYWLQKAKLIIQRRKFLIIKKVNLQF